MRSTYWVSVLLLCGVGSCSDGRSAAPGADAPYLTFRGSCDASAGVALSDDSFLVADDENNILRLYRIADGSMPIRAFDLTAHLAIDPENPEADIEGATRVGNRIYWISSHGRNKDGKMRPNRYRFFATDIEVTGDDVSIRSAGRPCVTLAQSLVASPIGLQLGIDKATRFDDDLSKKEREKLAPKEAGLNIEALAAAPDGRTLYIGFRNPLFPMASSKRAIVIPLENAQAVVEDSAAPRFGKAMLWDLGGRGLRSMEYCPRQTAFLLIAGDPDERDNFALYRWSGDAADSPTLAAPIKTGLPQFKPEAIIPLGGRPDVLVLSDDGAIMVKVGRDDCMDPDAYDQAKGACEQKYLRDAARKTFRAIRLTP